MKKKNDERVLRYAKKVDLIIEQINRTKTSKGVFLIKNITVPSASVALACMRELGYIVLLRRGEFFYKRDITSDERELVLLMYIEKMDKYMEDKYAREALIRKMEKPEQKKMNINNDEVKAPAVEPKAEVNIPDQGGRKGFVLKIFGIKVAELKPV